MLLSSEIIIYELSKKYELDTIVSLHRELELRAPQLYLGESELERGRVYVVPSAALKRGADDKSGAMIVLCRPSEEFPNENNAHSAVAFKEPQDAGQILNDILEIYQKYDSWDLSLRDLALVNGSLPDILLLSAPIFENDLSLVDPFLKPLVQANYAGNSYLTKFEVSINEILDMYENSRQELEAHRNDRRPYYAMPLAGFHGGALVLRLFNENSPIGILTIVGNNPLRAFDVPLLRRLAQYVEHALPGFLSVNNHFLSNTMQILLLEGRIDPDVMRSLLAMHGVNRSDTYRCLAISGSDGSRYDEIAHRPLESAFATLPGSVVLAFQEYLVAFVNWPAAEKEKRVEKVKAILERFQLNAGISDPFSEFMDARLYYLQAVEAQKLARAAGDTSRLADFRGYCCQYIVKSCSGAIRPELIYSEGFRNLIDQNRRAAFDYIETLEIYLDENMNAAKAAKRLFIQRNSFLYRLEQITAILGEDLRDPDARFLLNACLRLLRQSGG